MIDWQPIETAPKDGSTVRACRMIGDRPMFDGKAAWRTVTFPESFIAGMIVPEQTVTGWMRVDEDKRAPNPTHWAPE